MKKVLLALLCTLGLSANAQIDIHPSLDSAYTLVFKDEFNGSHVNDSLWILQWPWGQPPNETACVSCPCGDCDVCCDETSPVAYKIIQNDTHNIKINNGVAEIFVRKEPFYGQFAHWEDSVFYNPIIGDFDTVSLYKITHDSVQFTTALLFSRFNFKYGWFEMRFKLPIPPSSGDTYQPFGPDFWLYSGGSALNPPCWSEIDIFEITNGQTGYYTSNVHFEYCPPDTVHFADYYPVGNIGANVWHTAVAHWTPYKIDFYLDGYLYKTSFNHPGEIKDMPIVIGIAAPVSGTSLLGSDVKYPYSFKVDYLKVWQLNNVDCGTDLSYCDFNPIPTPYENVLVESFTTGGDSCSAYFGNISNFINHSTNYILLDENTTISNQAEMSLYVEGGCPLGENHQVFSPVAPPPASFNKLRKK
jgi:hypothetical protein